MSASVIPEDLLDAIVDAAVRRWPGVRVERLAVAECLAARKPDDAPGDGFGWLGRLKTDDLVLACGCLAGDRAALAALERASGRIAEEVLARHAGSGLDPAELQQDLVRRLLVADGGPPRLEQYGGRGPLEGFLRVMALRTAMNAARTHRRLETLDSTAAGRLVDHDAGGGRARAHPPAVPSGLRGRPARRPRRPAAARS